jgi:hypothetical protein
LIDLDKDEAILTLRKNRLDIEHQAILQDREVILVAETGIPITAANIIVTAQWYDPLRLGPVLVVLAVTMGVAEWLRRRKGKQLVAIRHEVDRFISELSSTKPPDES